RSPATPSTCGRAPADGAASTPCTTTTTSCRRTSSNRSPRRRSSSARTDRHARGRLPPMSPLDLSQLSGPDAVVALRSYPRRFREALAPVPDDPDIDELVHRISPDGTATIDHVVTAA